jgi:TP901 family phage tail tape measure protein
MANIGVKIELEGAPQYKENMANLTAQTKLYQAQVKSLASTMGSNMSAFQKSITTSKALEQQLESLKNKSTLLEQQIEKNTEKYGADSTNVIRLRTQYQNLQAEIANTEEELRRLGCTWGAVGAEFEAIGSKMQSVGDSLKSVGDTLTQKDTMPIAAIAGASVKVAADFESSMSKVAATMGFTVDQLNDKSSEASKTMEQLSEFAQEMGKTTAFSASEAADALNYMALAGYDAETSMEMLPTVLNLAAAGGINLASASDMVTDAQSALGLTLDETATMVDQMAAAASNGNTSVAQLGEAMLQIGATAANMTGGTQELSTALTVLADNGIKGAEGGTKLRNIILSLQDAAKDGAVDFGNFSVSVYDSEGNLRGVTDIMQDLQSNLEGMNQESKDAIISGVFNKQDLAAANAMLQTSSERYDELAKSIGDSAGAAQQMADVQLDNFQGQLTLLKSALEGVGIDIGTIIMPYLQKFVEKIQSVVDWFSNLDAKSQDLIVKAGLIVAAIGPILSIAGSIVGTIGKISSSIGTIVKIIPTVISAVSTIGTVITGTLIPAIAGVVTAILPFLPLIAAVAAAIAAVILVITHWAEITDFIKEKWAILTEFLATATEQIQTFFVEHFGIIGQLFATKIEIIKTVITTAVNVIKILLQTTGQIIKALIDGDWSKIGQIIKTAWESIKKAINDGIINVIKALTNMGTKARETFNELINNAKEWGSHFVQNFCDGITAKMQALVDKVRSMAETVSSYLHFSSGPEVGPLKNMNQWPVHMMQNYARGIESARYIVKGAVADVAADVSVLSSPFDTAAMYDAVRAGASDASISLAIGDREFTRALRDMGVIFNG